MFSTVTGFTFYMSLSAIRTIRAVSARAILIATEQRQLCPAAPLLIIQVLGLIVRILRAIVRLVSRQHIFAILYILATVLKVNVTPHVLVCKDAVSYLWIVIRRLAQLAP